MSGFSSDIPDKSGVLYIAFGEQYKQETKQSIISLREHSPELHIAVITDKPWECGAKPDNFILREQVEGFRCKPVYMSDTPFQRTLFLDTDTIVARDCSRIFELLDHYDIGVQFTGAQLNKPGLTLHTQCSSGLVLFRRNPGVLGVFRDWLRRYKNAAETKVQTGGDARGLGDQRYLAIAIALSDVRPVHLPTYLHFVVFNHAVLSSPPMVCHGRMKYMGQVPKQLGIGRDWKAKEHWRSRLWLANTRGLMPRGVRRSDPFMAMSLILRRLVNNVRRWWLSLSG